MKEKYFYLYEIRNKLNGKTYIGVHQTYNLDDGYMGSGKHLKRAQEKYGLENFEKEILFFFDSEESMYSKEKEIVTTEFVLREDTYNLTEGGKTPGFSARSKGGRKGGFKGGKYIFENRLGIFSESSQKKLREWLDSEECKEIAKKSLTIAIEKAKSTEAREKRKETFKEIKHQQGEKNSQFGKMWITNGTENTKIMKDETVPEGWRKGRIQIHQKGEKNSMFGKMWITNGTENIIIMKDKVVPEGWRKGRTLKK